MYPKNPLSCLLPHSNPTIGGSGNGGSFAIDFSVATIQPINVDICGVTSPLADAKSSKNNCIVSVIALVPVNCGTPPGFVGLALRATPDSWLNEYSVGLNMQVSGA